MAKEILAIPEEDLREVIEIIRTGMSCCGTSGEVEEGLTRWCNDMIYYLNGHESWNEDA